MDIMENIFSLQIFQKLGWTLIHFLWQAALVALVLAALLRGVRKSNANLRYLITCMGMALIVLMPVATMLLIQVSAPVVPITEPLPAKLELYHVGEKSVMETSPALPSLQTGNVVASRVSLKDKVTAAIEPTLPYIVFGWFVGVFGLSIWHLGGWTQLQKLRRMCLKPVNALLTEYIGQAAGVLGVRRAVQLAESALVQVPTVIGWLKPVILLPASALSGLTAGQLEAILAHEMAHIRRHDYLVNMLQTVVEVLGFYHPAVWWISHKMRAERENCCDDLAVRVSGDRINYAKALSSMEEIRASCPVPALAASGGSLIDRIRRLAGKDSAGKEKTGWLPSVVAAVLIMSLIIPISCAIGDRAKNNDVPTNERDVIVGDDVEKNPQFAVTLSNGVSVELVGVCEHPGKGKKWWRPDGGLLQRPPYEATGSILEEREGLKLYEYALRVLQGPSNTSIKWAIPGTGHGSYTGMPIDPDGKRVYDLRVFTASQPEENKTVNVGIGLTADVWQTLATHPAEKDGRTMLPFVHDFSRAGKNIDIAMRVVAVTKTGQERGGSVSGRGGTILNSLSYGFDMPLAEIKEFRFQTRPYEWGTFRNVSLKPDIKTDVQIVKETN